MTANESPPFEIAPRLKNERGEVRTAGFEIEYTGVSLREACELIRNIYGGTLDESKRFLHYVRDTSRGDFRVEVDARLLKEERYRKTLEDLGLPSPQLPEDAAAPSTGERLAGAIEDFVEDVLARVAEFAIPFEIVTPPLPIDDLGPLDELRERLRERRALGSGASVIYAFGLHINPEAPSMAASDLQAHMMAFLVLEPRLQREARLDFTRQYLSPYIGEFPQSYVELILAPGYEPELPQLVRDYLEHNPTRNRPLDMLPLFLHAAGAAGESVEQEVEAAVRAALPDNESHLVSGRPTYHFRMPDCRLDDPSWSIAFEWNRWLQVERLAADPERLRELAREAVAVRREGRDWRERLEELLS